MKNLSLKCQTNCQQKDSCSTCAHCHSLATCPFVNCAKCHQLFVLFLLLVCSGLGHAHMHWNISAQFAFATKPKMCWKKPQSFLQLSECCVQMFSCSCSLCGCSRNNWSLFKQRYLFPASKANGENRSKWHKVEMLGFCWVDKDSIVKLIVLSKRFVRDFSLPEIFAPKLFFFFKQHTGKLVEDLDDDVRKKIFCSHFRIIREENFWWQSRMSN